ncbi:hypothetical protein [Deinococcus koreensis]|nr:hypothetical protein [Deinococcus koreensis]
MLNALFFPLLFSMSAGTYAYLKFSDRRPRALLILTLFQLLGASAYAQQPDQGLFAMLAVHAILVFFLLLHHLQTPALAAEQRRQR